MDNIPPGPWGSFVAKTDIFMTKTEEHALQGVNPGGYYQAIWCRDASYILRDWTLTGNIAAALQQLYLIWSHQIQPGKEKLVYGRGSPEMKFMSEEAKGDKQKEFAGALPTTIYQAGFSEIYAQNPDIDSTALMISTTAWILNKSLKHHSLSGGSSMVSTTASEHSADYVSGLLLKLGITDPTKAIDFLVPRMLRAVDYLASRDIDNDGLLEQSHNEDWMDTVLRAGKIVYSQACWIVALTNFAKLLSSINKINQSRKITTLVERAINAVDKILWSEEDRSYLDMQEEHHLGARYRTLMQDVSLYLIAAKGQLFTNDTKRENIKYTNKMDVESSQRIQFRSIMTLDTIKSRLWKKGWPLVTEVELKKTGPWVIKPHQYHNETCWPWSTALEMIARAKFNQFDDCTTLLSKLTSGRPYMYSLYEWINPINKRPQGAFPFRTGVSAARLAIADILQQ